MNENENQNQNQNQNTSFVMQGEGQTQAGYGQERPQAETQSTEYQAGSQAENTGYQTGAQGAGYQAQQQQINTGYQQANGYQAQPNNAGYANANTGYQQGPSPQPMPSSDNVYRFQNTPAPKKKKERKKPSFGRVVAAAAVFGVIAAACFFGVNTLMGNIFGKSDTQIASTKQQTEQTRLGTVSGGASTKGISDVSDIVEEVMPSIVSITEKTTQQSYFGQKYVAEGAGSGFIVKQDDDQLLLVTNNHVVSGAEEITVTFCDDETAKATVKGTSKSNDLAVITVNMKDLKESTKKAIKVATLGSSDDAKVGEMVIAIGNAAGVGQSVTVGYLSAKEREFTASDSNGETTTQIMLQTDAAINPGNSGGALIDTKGAVIGINSSKRFQESGYDIEGMGYAIPMSDAVSVINDLMEREVLKDTEKGYLGITGEDIDEQTSKSYNIPIGVYVKAISDTGAAAKAGIKQGDVIVKIDNTSVKKIDEVKEIVNSKKIGATISVTVKRSDGSQYKEKVIKVTLESKDTLDGLPDDSSSAEDQDDRSQSDGNEYVIPWGGFGY